MSAQTSPKTEPRGIADSAQACPEGASGIETRAVVPQWRKNRDRLDGMSLSIEMAGSVVLGWYLGKLFDEHFLSGPWGMIFFVLAGVIAAGKAVMRFYRQAKKVMAQKEPGVEIAIAMDRARAGQAGGMKATP